MFLGTVFVLFIVTVFNKNIEFLFFVFSRWNWSSPQLKERTLNLFTPCTVQHSTMADRYWNFRIKTTRNLVGSSWVFKLSNGLFYVLYVLYVLSIVRTYALSTRHYKYSFKIWYSYCFSNAFSLKSDYFRQNVNYYVFFFIFGYMWWRNNDASWRHSLVCDRLSRNWCPSAINQNKRYRITGPPWTDILAVCITVMKKGHSPIKLAELLSSKVKLCNRTRDSL